MSKERKIICRTCRESLDENEFPHGSNECYDCQETREEESSYSAKDKRDYSRNIDYS